MYIVSTLAGQVDQDAKLKRAFKRIKDEINIIIDKARDLSHELAPPSLKYIGLVGAVKKMIRLVMTDTRLKITLTHKNMNDVTFGANDIVIYRIAQEALKNILKHSQATEVKVRMQYVRGYFILEIRDNGKGFDLQKFNERTGLGVDLMRERTKLINGVLDVVSDPRSDTIVRLTVSVAGEKKT